MKRAVTGLLGRGEWYQKSKCREGKFVLSIKKDCLDCRSIVPIFDLCHPQHFRYIAHYSIYDLMPYLLAR